MHFFSLCQIFWLEISEETNFGHNLAHCASHLNFWIFSVTSKHFSDNYVNIKQISSVKISKFNGFVLALFCILSLAQRLHLEEFQLCWLIFPEWTNFSQPKLVLFSKCCIIIRSVESKRHFSDNPCHNILALLENSA